MLGYARRPLSGKERDLRPAALIAAVAAGTVPAAGGEDAPRTAEAARAEFDRCAAIDSADGRLACYDGLAERWHLQRERIALGAWKTETLYSSADGSWSLRAAIPTEEDEKAAGPPTVRMIWTCDRGSGGVRIEGGLGVRQAALLPWKADGKDARTYEFVPVPGGLTATDPAATLDYLSDARRVRIAIQEGGGERRELSFRVAPGVNALIDAMRKCGTKMEPKSWGLAALVDPSRLSPPRAVHKVMPEYPELARKTSEEGKVVPLCSVATDGTLRVLRVLNAPVLDRGMVEAAAAAVSQWRYEPARLDGAPFEMTIAVVVRFVLDRR